MYAVQIALFSFLDDFTRIQMCLRFLWCVVVNQVKKFREQSISRSLIALAVQGYDTPPGMAGSQKPRCTVGLSPNNWDLQHGYCAVFATGHTTAVVCYERSFGVYVSTYNSTDVV